MNKIVVGSRNAGKIREIQAALADLPYCVTGLPDLAVPDAEETGTTFQENAILKARYYCQHTGEYCLADDSGLEVDALAGAPGVYSARYAGTQASDKENNQKLLAALANIPRQRRTARFRSVLALAGPDGSLILAEGVCEGVVLFDVRGTGGFGYDPLFFVPEQGKTMAEMTLAEKNRISHRGNALRALKEKLVQAPKEG
ncbi:MAG: XTP/dITP diphosphatase [Veillonellaceae bacterium]|nr:XTP/dITP diphosphatase [Veillonellaceae bacterium]